MLLRMHNTNTSREVTYYITCKTDMLHFSIVMADIRELPEDEIEQAEANEDFVPIERPLTAGPYLDDWINANILRFPTLYQILQQPEPSPDVTERLERYSSMVANITRDLPRRDVRVPIRYKPTKGIKRLK